MTMKWFEEIMNLISPNKEKEAEKRKADLTVEAIERFNIVSNDKGVVLMLDGHIISTPYEDMQSACEHLFYLRECFVTTALEEV